MDSNNCPRLARKQRWATTYSRRKSRWSYYSDSDRQAQNLNFAAPINTVKTMLASSQRVTPLTAVAESQGRISSRVWTSMASGLDREIRIDGDYVYTDWVSLPTGARDAGVFQRCELKKTGEIWRGKCRGTVRCQLGFWDNYEYRDCVTEWAMEMTSISDSRIEGRAQGAVDFDCKSCQAKKTQWVSFTWIPKE